MCTQKKSSLYLPGPVASENFLVHLQWQDNVAPGRLPWHRALSWQLKRPLKNETLGDSKGPNGKDLSIFVEKNASSCFKESFWSKALAGRSAKVKRKPPLRDQGFPDPSPLTSAHRRTCHLSLPPLLAQLEQECGMGIGVGEGLDS